MNVKIKKLYPDAIMPTYGTAGAACFDLYANTSAEFSGRTTIGTGLAFEIPEGHTMLVYSRSSHGKAGVRLANSVGVIDSDYRGEVKVLLEAAPGVNVWLDQGERIAQAMIVPVNQVAFTEVEQLSETARGAGGFGSTGR